MTLEPPGPRLTVGFDPLIRSSTGKSTSRRPRSVKELSDAYRQFRHRLTSRYKICDHPEEKSTDEINRLLGMIPGNTTQFKQDLRKVAYFMSAPLCLALVGIPYAVYYSQTTKFLVPDCHFAMVVDRSGKIPKTLLYGPGHHYLGWYRSVEGTYSFGDKVPDHLYQSSLGDLTILVVEQGTIAVLEYNGQYELLGPGLHMTHDTVKFIRTVKLYSYYIKIGPEKWITIPDQYDGLAIDNGRTTILKGGRQYNLAHENFILAKLIPKTVLTDRIVTDISKYVDMVPEGGELPTAKPGMLDPCYYMQVKTKDGAMLFLDILLIWRIVDTEKTALRAMPPIEAKPVPTKVTDEVSSHMTLANANIRALRKIILRYARSVIAEVVSHTCLTEDESSLSSGGDAPHAPSRPAATDWHHVVLHFAVQSFLNRQAEELTHKLNREIAFYGAEAIKITINDAIPMPELQKHLDQQAKAKINKNTSIVEAETTRQVAEEEIRTDRIRKLGYAENDLEAAKVAKKIASTEAEGLAQRERIIAQGRKEAAELQQSTELGKQLALVSAIGEATKGIHEGKGDRVYIVGSPLEALTRSFGNLGSLFRNMQ